MPRFIVAVCFAGCFALTGVAAPVPKLPPLIPPTPEVVAKWKERGAIFCWYGRNADTGEWVNASTPEGLIAPTLTLQFAEFEGTFEDLPKLTYPFTIEFHGGTLSKHCFKDFPVPDHLICMYIRLSKVDGGFLKSLNRFTSLVELRLISHDIENKSLIELKELPALRKLELTLLPGLTNGVSNSNEKYANNGFEYFRDLTELRELRVRFTAINDEGIKNVAELKNLRVLDLEGADITDTGLKYVKGLKNLEELSVPQKITNEGLVHLKELKNLKKLWLYESQITDDGTESLAKFEQLELIFLRNTKVSGAGGESLKKKLPKCRVIRANETSPNEVPILPIPIAPIGND
jgi:hypothetical protein